MSGLTLINVNSSFVAFDAEPKEAAHCVLVQYIQSLGNGAGQKIYSKSCFLLVGIICNEQERGSGGLLMASATSAAATLKAEDPRAKW